MIANPAHAQPRDLDAEGGDDGSDEQCRSVGGRKKPDEEWDGNAADMNQLPSQFRPSAERVAAMDRARR
ncbi:MAG: hypothetical protein WD737_08405 [Gemmatimonadota bacterium]